MQTSSTDRRTSTAGRPTSNSRAHLFKLLTLLVSLAIILIISSCYVQTQTRKLTPPAEANSFDHGSQYIKAHMRNGDVYILSEWSIKQAEKNVIGKGVLLGPNRDTLAQGPFTVCIDSVAIFETNTVHISSAVVALTIVTAASVAITIYCAANPKACFGSCPTFYAWDGSKEILQAEGFSASVLPSLEATDIDALYRAQPRNRRFSLRMTNEALETHVVRHVDLLAARRPEGGRVFATLEGRFWEALSLAPPTRCVDDSGDCTAKLTDFDGVERYSKTDSLDLTAKEIVDLYFDVPKSGNAGIVLACRQSLLSTYLFYQTLAYMGSSVGDWMARLERNGKLNLATAGGVGNLLGGIEIMTENAKGKWISQGIIQETGPLATDVHLLPLPDLPEGTQRLRLRLTKGAWRIDWAALAILGKPVIPLRLHPTTVMNDSLESPDALKQVLDSSKALTTLPGDAYTFIYDLPEDFGNYELFLESRGYYLEWMRQEWLPEENPGLAAMMFVKPQESLRLLAPQFKQIEDSIETVFWNSRYAH